MTNTTLIPLIAVLDLAAVLAVFAIVRFTHRLDRRDQRRESPLISQPSPQHLALPADAVEELSRAA
ncbi:MAG TPA: hypothetical protein VKB43_04180 [Gaiellaceae bacterium]|nr:hypothetical protein [Gaiellaceae bacterium]